MLFSLTQKEDKMNFINSANTSIKVYTYKNHLRDIAWKKTPRIEHGHAFDQHQETHNVELEVFADRPGYNSWIGDSRYISRCFPVTPIGPSSKPKPQFFLNTGTVIITHREENRFVDWDAVTAPYRSAAKAIGVIDDSSNAAAEAAIKISVMLLSGLSTGLSALGSAGALPAGLASMLLSIIGSVNDEAPPPPPDAREIEDIVTTVVKRELAIHLAQEAAIVFMGTSKRLLTFSHLSFRRLFNTDGKWSGNSLTPHELNDFEDFIHQSLEIGRNSLAYFIEYLAKHSDTAMWILPAYLNGISAYLTIYRIHLVWAATERESNSPITTREIEDYRKLVEMQKNGLDKAYDAYESYIKEKVSATHLNGTIKEEELKGVICKSMFGVNNVQSVKVFLEKLDKIIYRLKEIESGNVKKFIPH